MKYLKPLILESKQVGIIYHFTNLWSLIEMFKNDNFKIKSDKHYISFTRNPIMFSPELMASKLQCRIMVDGNKLSNKYSIEPFLDFKNVKKDDGEQEERILKMKTPFDFQLLPYVDITNSILEIDILDEPIFRSKTNKDYEKSSKLYQYDKEKYFHTTELEPIILKHKEQVNKIWDMVMNKNYNFDINVVSKFTNPKYQDKFILGKLN